jgi:cytochrome c5
MRAVIGLCLVMLATAASAHHSIIGVYDLKTERVLQGVISKYEWANPHVYVYLDVAQPDGTSERWTLLGLPPTMLQRRGWTRDSLTVGEAVTVHVFPSLMEGKPSAAMRTVTKADGTELSNAPPEGSSEGGFPSANGQAPPLRARSLSGIWLTEPGELAVAFGILGHPDVELTPAGAAAHKAFKQNRDIPGVDCVPLPPPMYVSIASVMSLEIGSYMTFIRSELEDVVRTVHMTVSNHEGVPETLYGHSIGHWEGNVLVVDTAHFANNRIGTVAGVPSGPRKHLVERFQLDPDGATLTYSFVLEDPDYLAKPMTASIKWRYQPGLKYSPVKCELDTARRYLADLVPAKQAASGAGPVIPTSGQALVQQTCSLCHSAHIGGAPTVGDPAEWKPLIAKGKDVLYSHALQGFKGTSGICPQKGGRWDLPDAVVEQAVDYMVSAATAR